MIDAAAYRANETNAKRAIADWRLSNINDPYVFQNQGFPVRADSFLDLAQILDTMQEGRFDFYMNELGGFTPQDLDFFVKVCVDYVDFYTSFFQRERVIVPLSTLIAHFVAYRKLLGYNPGFGRVLELGPGCGYLSFFLRHHKPLADYTQIESTESFYLLQSHINAHVFGTRFAEHAVSRHALQDHAKYVPNLNWHNPFHYEDQKIISVAAAPVCNHYPWWRIGEVAQRKYDLIASNANLNEFSREALFQYLSLIREVLSDNGAIVAQCLGGGPPSYDTIFANMKSAGFVPVALIAGGADMGGGRVFVVSNAVFVGERHPMFAQYADKAPKFPMLDRELPFQNKMYFLNEEQTELKRKYTTYEVLEVLQERLATSGYRPAKAAETAPESKAKVAAQAAPSLRDNNRLRPVAESTAPTNGESERDRADRQQLWIEARQLRNQVAVLRNDLQVIRASNSWRVTAPLRAVSKLLRSLRP
jgi:phospholipid N-methyltransferase